MNSNLNKRMRSAAVIRCKETEQYRHQRVQTEKRAVILKKIEEKVGEIELPD